MRRNSAKIFGFAAGLIIILALLSIVFDGSRWVRLGSDAGSGSAEEAGAGGQTGGWREQGYVADRDARIAGISLEEPGLIDVLNVGDSVCNISLTPMELFHDYGYTAYNMGRDLQKPVESYFYIRKALEKQPVKVIFWEAHNLFRDENIVDFGGRGLSEYLKFRIPFIKYHYIWKYWLEGPGIRRYYKGYLVNEAVKPYTGEDYYYWPDKEIYPIQPREQMIFRFVLNYCKKRDIKLVLYSGASAFCYDIRMHNAVAKFAEECGVEYHDANYERDKIQIDWENDTFDGGDHLNLFGARKMTKYLGDYLASECDLTDHRGDPAYRSWQELWTSYEQEVERMKGTSYPLMEAE